MFSKKKYLLSESAQVCLCSVDPVHCGNPKQVVLDSDEAHTGAYCQQAARDTLLTGDCSLLVSMVDMQMQYSMQ